MRGALLLLAVGLLCLQPTVGRFSSLLDEGLVTSPAARVVEGQVLYRDIYLFTTPGPVLFLAGAFKLLGTSIEAAHWALLGLKLALLLALYWVSRLLVGSTPWALGPPLAFLALGLDDPMNYINHQVPNLPFLLAVGLAMQLVLKPSAPTAVALGAATTLTGLTLQTFGVAAAVPAAFAVLKTRRFAGPFLTGLVLAGLPFVVWLWSEGLVGQFFTDTVASNVHRSSLERVTPQGFLRSLWLMHGPGSPWPQFLTGVLLVFTQVAGLLAPLFVRHKPPELQVALVAGWMMMLACSYRLLPSQLLLHGFMPLVLMAWTLRQGGWRKLAIALLLASGLLAGQHTWAALQTRYPVRFPRGLARVGSEAEAQDLQKLVRFLERRAPGGAAFFVPYEPNLYFLMGLRNPTRYLQMRPLQYSREQMADALRHLGDCPVFRFPAYETDDFLRWGWPDIDLSVYRAEEAWFYSQLEQTHRREDFGAVQLYVPKEP